MFTASKKKMKEDITDTNAQQMTLKSLKIKTNPKTPMLFNTLMKNFKTVITKGHICQNVNNKQQDYFEDIFQEKDIMKSVDFDAAFLEYKETAFAQWKFLTPEKV